MVKTICIEHFEEFPEHVIVRPAWTSDERMPIRYVCESTCRIKNTTDICNRDFYTTAKCSRCKASYTIDFKYLKYCPNCGAKVVE